MTMYAATSNMSAGMSVDIAAAQCQPADLPDELLKSDRFRMLKFKVRGRRQAAGGKAHSGC